MENTKIINIKNFLMILVIMISIISLGTFAWLSYRSNDTAMVLTIGEIDGMSVTLKPYQINSSLNPVTTYDSGIVIDVTANNKKSSSDNFKLFYKIDSIDSELVNSSFKYTVTKSTNNGSTYTEVKTGDFSTASSNSELEIYKESVPGNNTTYLYKVYLWIDGNMGDQSAMQGKVFTGELRAKIGSNLPSFITDNGVLDSISSTYVSSSSGIDFTQISSDTNGKGLYIRSGTENDENPIYYYRGDVDNNNVYFANYCWKIIRTTDTGGLKIVYNGEPKGAGTCTSGGSSTVGLTPEDITKAKVVPLVNNINTKTNVMQIKDPGGTGSNPSAFNSSYNDAKYVGYMYDNNTTDSTIKTYIDAWYQNNMTSYASFLEDTVWCNDRSTHTLSEFTQAEIEFENLQEGMTIYGPLYRHAKGTPRLTCPNIADAFTVSNTTKGNGKLTYPIALLTMDEIWLAGTDNQYNSNNYYLYNDEWWWSLSPIVFAGGYAYVWRAAPGNGLSGDRVNSNRGARVAVSLKPGLTFTYGNGTGVNPYRFDATVTPGNDS